MLRKKESDGSYINYWTIKTNGRLGEIAYDKYYDDKAPSGYYGLTVEFSFAGQNQHGVTIRLLPGEALQMLIQDDLTDVNSFNCTVQGHVVE